MGPVLKETFRNGQIQLPFHKRSHQWTFQAYKVKDDTIEWSNKFLQSTKVSQVKS